MTMSGDVHIGVVLPTSAPAGLSIDVRAIASTAEWAESAGVDSAWVADHIFHPVQLHECLTTLAFVAARTRTIQLGSGVLLLPMRQVSVVAKQISTLAQLSEGRFLLGVGVGGEWPAEWIAAGVPMTERGARFDEAVPLLRRLFAGETVDFTGRFTTLPQVALTPPPPPIPFYFAGRARPALERAALHGDGWLAYLLTVTATTFLKMLSADYGLPLAMTDQLHFTDAAPSGHMALATVVYGSAALFFRNAGRTVNAVLGQAACVAVILIVGVTRVTLGCHSVADVLGGLAVGGAACRRAVPVPTRSHTVHGEVRRQSLQPCLWGVGWPPGAWWWDA